MTASGTVNRLSPGCVLSMRRAPRENAADSECAMFRVTGITSLLSSRGASVSRSRLLATIRRSALRYVDADGREIRDLGDVEAEPRPTTPTPGDGRPGSRLQRASRKQRALRAKEELNRDALHFIRSVSVISSRNTKKDLRQEKQIVLEGEKVIMEAFGAGVHLQKIFHDRPLSRFPGLAKLLEAGAETQLVSPSDMAVVSKLTTPPGILAIAEKPSLLAIESRRPMEQVMPVLVVADSISDPGNLGGLLRSMAASGASSLIVTEQSVYAWDVKVVRAGAGAHFFVPIRSMSWDRIRSRLQTVDRIFFAEPKNSADSCRLPVAAFDEINYFSDPSTQSVLFLGSESHGFGAEAQQLFSDRRAQRVCVPMSSGFESLNNYVAASVILFQMRQQYNRRNKSS